MLSASSDAEIDFFGVQDPDELSYGRVRRLSTTDPDEVIKAISGAKHDKKKRVSVLPIIGIIVFCALYIPPILPEYPCAQTCLAILVLGGYCWGTEVLPSYITAYLIPILAVWFKVGYDKETGTRIAAGQMAVRIAAKFTDPIIFVFLGSLTMSAALTKLHITERVSSFALSRISHRPRVVLLTIMLLNFSTAAFLSNIASTTLMLTFSLPIIRSLDPNDTFIKALLFGLAWSGNAGGLVTTIASVQNILAIKYINETGGISISFFEWVAFAGPTATVILFIYWGYLCLKYRPPYDSIAVDTKKGSFGNWTWKHTFACCVTVITIILWALEETFSSFFGHVGITALLPVVTLFGTGILNSEDFGHLRWSTLSLMGGGIALGEAMDLSGLLDLISDNISSVLSGIPLWAVVFIFLCMEAILVSVINHTSAAAILFPALNAIGVSLGNSTILLTLSALMIGNAQLFHISSFPTALVSGVQKHVRNDPSNLLAESFLSGPEFFFVGWPTVTAAIIVISTVGYGIVLGLGL